MVFMETHGTIPDWVVIMAYQNLPGCPSPYRAVCD